MPQLFLLLIGCKPPARHIEQHDIFVGIGESVKDLIPALIRSWPEAAGNLHIDGWRAVTCVNGYHITVSDKERANTQSPAKLFFINLGGYKPGKFEEFHYKMLVAAADKGAAIQQAKATAFYRHTGFPGASSHVDDKYGVDVDDLYEIEDILPADSKARHRILVSPAGSPIREDEIHLGYFKLEMFAR